MTRAEVRSQERLFRFKFNMEFMGRPCTQRATVVDMRDRKAHS